MSGVVVALTGTAGFINHSKNLQSLQVFPSRFFINFNYFATSTNVLFKAFVKEILGSGLQFQVRTDKKKSVCLRENF
jgi:hypothetical protein